PLLVNYICCRRARPRQEAPAAVQGISPPGRKPMPTPTSPFLPERWSLRLAWLTLAGLLLLGIPLFLCMPVWPDVIHYDLCARNILRGGVHYRDVGDFNLPGMVWVHAGIRSLFGWRIETLRALDLLVVAANVWLLVRWLKLLGVRADLRAW